MRKSTARRASAFAGFATSSDRTVSPTGGFYIVDRATDRGGLLLLECRRRIPLSEHDGFVARIPEFEVALFTGSVEIGAGLKEGVDVLPLHGVEGFESDVS